MRHHFQHQPDLQITSIDEIRLPRKSLDELPPLTKKSGAPAPALELKADTYVLETDVHFPQT